ncbi:hypothetical protein [Micromonospora sp. NPDC049679]|uniref:hypothetical protein n=1 Tax=Micromonospora sp. NPDC049679 TaxID=3155920 RepID=UPI0033F34C3E
MAVEVVLAATALVTAMASDTVVVRSRGERGTAADPTGRITVTLPEGWRAEGAGWEGQRGPAVSLINSGILLFPERHSGNAQVNKAFDREKGGFRDDQAGRVCAGQEEHECDIRVCSARLTG